MTLQPELYARITPLDVRLARIYFPLLVELARSKDTLSYGELVKRAQSRHSGNPDVDNAIAVSAGRRLEVIRLYCKQKDLPDLASLIVNSDTQECGSLYTAHFDPVEAREAVFAMDWEDRAASMDDFLHEAEKAVKPRRSRTNAQARELMGSHYRSHKERLPAGISSQRDLILELLMEGFDADEAFERAKEALT